MDMYYFSHWWGNICYKKTIECFILLIYYIMSNITDQHQSLLNDITRLQELEMRLLGELENTTDTKLIRTMTQKIQEVSSIRENLFEQLGALYESNQKLLNTQKESVANQMALADIVEDELNKTRLNVDRLEKNKLNKRRLVELGKWESDRYEAHIHILRRIAMGFVLIFIVSLLLQQKIIPGNVATILIIIIIVLLIINVSMNMYDLSQRNEFDYQKYNFYYDKNALKNMQDVNNDDEFDKLVDQSNVCPDNRLQGTDPQARQHLDGLFRRLTARPDSLSESDVNIPVVARL